MIHQTFFLPNDLPVLVVPLRSLASATVTLWVKVGSRGEEEKVSGISHFLEHMVFKGSKARPSAKKISEAVDAIGGEFNAATSKEWTLFYIKSQAKKIEVAFDVLSDMVLNPLLREKDIDKERGVILEEMAMYEDTPMIKIGDVFEETIFEGNSLGRDTIGSAGAVKSIKRQDFVKFRDRHYLAQNMLLTVSGGVSLAQVKRLGEKYFGQAPGSEGPSQGTDLYLKPGPRFKVHSKKKDQAHFILGFLADGRGYEGRFAQAVLSTILGGGMSSRLFSEVREKRGLAYAVKTSIERYLGAGFISTYAGVDPKKINEAIKVVMEEHYKISNLELPGRPAERGAGGRIENSELSKAKEYLKGHLALSLEDTKDVNGFFGERLLMEGKIETPEEVLKKIDGVTVEDVVRQAKRIFSPGRLFLAIIGPYKDTTSFEKLLKGG